MIVVALLALAIVLVALTATSANAQAVSLIAPSPAAAMPPMLSVTSEYAAMRRAEGWPLPQWPRRDLPSVASRAEHTARVIRVIAELVDAVATSEGVRANRALQGEHWPGFRVWDAHAPGDLYWQLPGPSRTFFATGEGDPLMRPFAQGGNLLLTIAGFEAVNLVEDAISRHWSSIARAAWDLRQADADVQGIESWVGTARAQHAYDHRVEACMSAIADATVVMAPGGKSWAMYGPGGKPVAPASCAATGMYWAVTNPVQGR